MGPDPERFPGPGGRTPLGIESPNRLQVFCEPRSNVPCPQVPVVPRKRRVRYDTVLHCGGPRRACPPSHSGRRIPQRGRPPPARRVRSRGSLGCSLRKYCPSGHPSPWAPPRGLGQRGTPRPDHVTLKYSSPGGGQAALTRAAQAGRGTADGPPENIIGFPPPCEKESDVSYWRMCTARAACEGCCKVARPRRRRP